MCVCLDKTTQRHIYFTQLIYYITIYTKCMAYQGHLPLNLFMVLFSSDKEKVRLPDLLLRWEINFKRCCRIAILYFIIIMQDVFRTVPGSFDHLVVPLQKLLQLLSSSLNYVVGRLGMKLSDINCDRINTFPFEMGQFWDGLGFAWESTWDFWRPCAQGKEPRVNIRPQSCMSWLRSLVESDREKREDGNIRS